MFLIYCFLAFLSLSLHNATRNVGEEDGDIPAIYTGSSLMLLNLWFFITGFIIPAIMLFLSTKWYLAIIYMVVGILISMILANNYMYKYHVARRPPLYIPSRVDLRPSLVMNIVSIIFLIIVTVWC